MHIENHRSSFYLEKFKFYSETPKNRRIRLSPHHRRNCNSRSIPKPSEIKIDKQKLFFLAQSESFPVDVNVAHKKQSPEKSSRIASFPPFIRPGGLVHSTGRIRRLTAVEFNVKHPIILGSRHLLVKMLLTFIHQKNHHQSVDYLRAGIHLEPVVLGLRTALRSVDNHCVLCRKRKTKVITPMLADLPLERLGYRQPPFTGCVVDFFGPFQLTIRQSSEKH